MEDFLAIGNFIAYIVMKKSHQKVILTLVQREKMISSILERNGFDLRMAYITRQGFT